MIYFDEIGIFMEHPNDKKRGDLNSADSDSEADAQQVLPLLPTQGDRIRYARLEKEMTQRELAEIVGMKQGNIALYETNARGLTYLPMNSMLAISSALDVSIDWILTGSEKNPVSHGKLVAFDNKYAPILAWHEVHQWIIDGGSEGMDSSQRDSVPVHGLDGKRCFGLKMEEKHGYAQNHFQLNDTLIIDPDKSPAVGNYVLLSHDSGNTIHLRKMAVDNKVELLDMCVREDLTETTIIYGVVVAQFRNLI